MGNIVEMIEHWRAGEGKYVQSLSRMEKLIDVEKENKLNFRNAELESHDP